MRRWALAVRSMSRTDFYFRFIDLCLPEALRGAGAFTDGLTSARPATLEGTEAL